MVGRASARPGWPVDPRRSAGPAPHRPPRGAISRTRAPGSTRAGDRLTPGYSPPRHQPTNGRTCLRRPAALRTPRFSPITPITPRTCSSTETDKTDTLATTHAVECCETRKLLDSIAIIMRLRRRIHAFLGSRPPRRRTENVF